MGVSHAVVVVYKWAIPTQWFTTCTGSVGAEGGHAFNRICLFVCLSACMNVRLLLLDHQVFSNQIWHTAFALRCNFSSAFFPKMAANIATIAKGLPGRTQFDTGGGFRDVT